MKEILCRQNSWAFYLVSPGLLLSVSAGYCQTAQADETEMIRTQMGKHNRLVMVAVYGMPYAIPPLNSNRNTSDVITVWLAGVPYVWDP
jgi:hypothetical protein